MPEPVDTGSRTPKGRATHRRNETARLAVLHAADDLLAEKGFNAVSVEGIAARAGVAKQTIYRWWPSKVDILLDTLVDDAQERLGSRQERSGADGMRRHLRDLATLLTKDPAGKVLLALLGEAQHDETVAVLLRERYLEPWRDVERAILRRGVEAGELAAELDVDAALDAMLGPIVYRALTGARIPRAFVDGLVDRTLRPA